jgi:geranylgeranyl pyrophosphate synthase
VKLHGLEKSRALATEHTDRALAALRSLPGNAAFLNALVESMAQRRH